MSKDDIHVMPVNDKKEHEMSVSCHCKPRIEVEGAALIIIHNAYDHREIIEQIEVDKYDTADKRLD